MARIKIDADAPPREVRMTDEKLIYEFEQMLTIDKNALDDALEQHPDLMYRVSEILTERIAQRDAAKHDVAEAEAKADAEVRKAASIAEEKVTDKAVASEVKLDRKVMTAADRHANLVYWCNRWSALQAAFSARQAALRELVSLYGNNYWSDASTGRASAFVKTKAGEIARDALAAERKRRQGSA